jgi:preprotein translocase subunit Sec61beta
MTFVAESGIAAIAIDPVTTMAVVAAAMAAVMLRIAHPRANRIHHTT